VVWGSGGLGVWGSGGLGVWGSGGLGVWGSGGLTQHGEDEVLGRVDLQSPLVVVLPQVVLAELLDEAVQVLHAGRGPEVDLRAAAAVQEPPGGAVPEAARGASPAGESRGRHLSSGGRARAHAHRRSLQPRPTAATTTGNHRGTSAAHGLQNKIERKQI